MEEKNIDNQQNLQSEKPEFGIMYDGDACMIQDENGDWINFAEGMYGKGAPIEELGTD